MKALEFKTEIAAPATEVYKVLMDFESYPSWNPFIVNLNGTPTVGNKLEASIRMGERPPQSFKVTVLKNEPNREFRWIGYVVAGFLYRGEHYFSIEDTDAGCIFTHGENFYGLLEPLITMLYEKDFEPTYRSLNQALKHRVEGREK